jgi:hypothetical protein
VRGDAGVAATGFALAFGRDTILAMLPVRKIGVVAIVGILVMSISPAFAAPKSTVAKKGKDFVGRADQKRDKDGVYNFQSGAYRITTDVDKDLANDVAAHMDEVYKEYDKRLAGFRPNPYAAVKPNERMPLYVMRRYKDYVSLLAGFGFNAANSGGVFFRTENKQSGLATWVEGQSRLKMYYVLQHEGFHQFADARIMPGLPPWVNEGLAEYFGDAIMVEKKLLVGRLDQERIERMRRAVKEKQTIPFGELMTMSNERWASRVTSGDKAASLMYDSAWSVCYFLIHGGKKSAPLRVDEGPALEYYLRLLNFTFVKDPYNDPRPAAFATVFSNNLTNFETAWKSGLERLEPDPWFSSVRHLQFIAAALKAFHEKSIEVKSWSHLKEQLIRYKFKTTIRERDVVNRGEREEKVEDVEQSFEFPKPAEVEFIKSEDPKLPHGMLITNVTPNIRLSWRLNASGDVEEDISYVDPPKVAKKPPVAVKKSAAAKNITSTTKPTTRPTPEK